MKKTNYTQDYNQLEQFLPLHGGGEFRWHHNKLSDPI